MQNKLSMQDKIRDMFLRQTSKSHMNRTRLPIDKSDFKNYPAYGAQSVVNYNSTSMELVDSRFTHRGEMNTVSVFIASFLVSIVYTLLFGLRTLHMNISAGIDFEYIHYLGFFIEFVISLVMFAFIVVICVLNKSYFFDYDIKRVLFNRVDKTVCFMDYKGRFRLFKWDGLNADITEVVENTDMHNQIEFFDKDNEERHDPLFVLGFYKDEFKTLAYWEFIRSYMEEDEYIVGDLANTIEYFVELTNGRERFWIGFLTIVSNYLTSRFQWVWLPILLPYAFVSSCFRWIGMRTCKTFVWPEEVLQACTPELNDPINMSCSIDTVNRWARAFILLPKEYYTQRNKRIFTAQENIYKFLSKKYKY